MPPKKPASQAVSQASQRQKNNAEANIENENLTELVNKCVRYVIYRSGTNEPIKKNELKKNVLVNAGRNFDRIIKKAADILEKVYGFNLITCEDNNNVSYITVQNVEQKDLLYENEEEIPPDANKILILLVLTNIFMSANSVNEASMLIFLSALGIDVDTDKGLFGKVTDFINITMVRQNYITTQTDPISREVTYKWGARAENTVSKHNILTFVSKMYGNRLPTAWTAQYEEANSQVNDNEVEANQSIAID